VYTVVHFTPPKGRTQRKVVPMVHEGREEGTMVVLSQDMTY
jgi:hypothetical protein